MIFNLFKTSSRARREPGKRYMTEAQKDLGVAAEVAARSGAETVLLVVHFDSTLRRVCATCAAASNELSPPIPSSSELFSAAAARSGVKRALLVRSGDAKSLSTMSRQSAGSRSFGVIVADMHPLQSREQQVDALADALPGKTRIMRFGSMDDP